MAVIENVQASLVSFAVNNVSSRLNNNVGTYGTSEILNGGELLENQLSYTFRVTGLIGHTIQAITVYSLLLTNTGGLCSARRIAMSIPDYGSPFSGNMNANDQSKSIIPVTFTQSGEVTGDLTFPVNVSMSSTSSCYYGMHSISIDLQDVSYSVKLTFSGPTSNRSASNITVSTLVVNRDAVPVTFSKDPTLPFNPEIDNVEGRMYLKQDGIYVDGTKYGTVAPATDAQLGLVKLFDNFEIDEDGGIVAPDAPNTAATPRLVYNAIGSIIAGITAPNVFIEEQVIPDGEEEPTIQDRQITDKFIFSDEFESIGEDNRIHIKWLEII